MHQHPGGDGDRRSRRPVGSHRTAVGTRVKYKDKQSVSSAGRLNHVRRIVQDPSDTSNNLIEIKRSGLFELEKRAENQEYLRVALLTLQPWTWTRTLGRAGPSRSEICSIADLGIESPWPPFILPSDDHKARPRRKIGSQSRAIGALSPIFF